ncbi:MAG: type I-C CRISPR-associated protein Cas7/Csd2 [Oscillospiraceae bacterium]
MSALQNKIDFVALVSVTMANSNGDPLNGNRPRTNYDSRGEISDVCIKRKIRNRLQDMGQCIFVQSDDRCDDGCASLRDRAKQAIKDVKDRNEYARLACEKWIDVRSFGQVFAFKEKKKGDGVSVGVRGPVSIHQALSVSPVEIESLQITKSVNGETPSKKEAAEEESAGKRSSDTMGMKHYVRFGLYEVKGSINVQLAQKTGFSQQDAMLIQEALRTLFVNDASSARPEGSMEVYKLYWWQHNCPVGQYSSAKVHRLVRVKLKEGIEQPTCLEDYEISVDTLPDLVCEEIDGI